MVFCYNMKKKTLHSIIKTIEGEKIYFLKLFLTNTNSCQLWNVFISSTLTNHEVRIHGDIHNFLVTQEIY